MNWKQSGEINIFINKQRLQRIRLCFFLHKCDHIYIFKNTHEILKILFIHLYKYYMIYMKLLLHNVVIKKTIERGFNKSKHSKYMKNWCPVAIIMKNRLNFQVRLKRVLKELPWIWNSLVRSFFLIFKEKPQRTRLCFLLHKKMQI